MDLPTLRSDGLATDYTAADGCHCNNSVDCLGGALKFTGSSRTALIAASLAAFNPYLVMWGPMIRTYSLLAAFSLLVINEFFHWYWQRDWWSGVRCAGAVLLLLIAHLNGVYTVAFLILLLIAESISAGFSNGRRFLWQARTLWIPLAGVAIIVGAAYWRLLPDIAKVNQEWGTDTPPTSMAYVPQVFTTYMGIGYVAWLSVFLLLAGCCGRRCERSERLFCCVERSFWRQSLCPCKGSLLMHRRSPAISFVLFPCF